MIKFEGWNLLPKVFSMESLTLKYKNAPKSNFNNKLSEKSTA